MRYMGSKRSLFNEYYPFLAQYRRPDQVWVEPFMGGANSIDKVPGRRIGNDLHPQLMAMWMALQQGWEPPEEISEFEYYRLKQEQRVDALTGFAGFACAFAGQYFASYAKDDTGVNYAAQGKRTVLRQIAAMPAHEVVLYNGSYDAFPIPPNSFIYCDPPYAETGGYATGGFDHRRFWKWANRMVALGHTVVVAEYSAPPDWVPIWEKKAKTRLNTHTATSSLERIFARAHVYDEDAAREYYDPPLHKMYSIKQVLHFIARAGQKDNSHIVIDNLRATASNELFTASAPINIPFNAKPNTSKLISAIRVAEESRHPVSIDRTKAGRVQIVSGPMKAFIDVLDDDYLAQPLKPQGVFVNNPREVYAGIIRLAGIMCRDDIRPFANGVAIGKNSCMATNNYIFGEVWHGGDVPFSVTVPAETVDQLVKLDEEPERIQLSMNSITFWYFGERYITSCLVAEEFPIEKISAVMDKPALFVDISTDFYDAVKKIKRLEDGDTTVTVYPDCITTSTAEENGVTISIATGCAERAKFKLSHLASLDGLATKIDWAAWPSPVPFTGPHMRGLISGLR